MPSVAIAQMLTPQQLLKWTSQGLCEPQHQKQVTRGKILTLVFGHQTMDSIKSMK